MNLEAMFEDETGKLSRSDFSPSLEYTKWLEEKLNSWFTLKSKILSALEESEDNNLILIDDIHSI